MTNALNYAPPDDRPPTWADAIFAHFCYYYPIYFLTALYGEWFLAWLSLGHEPQCSLDDPKDINGSSFLHPITALALTGLTPTAVGIIVLTVQNLFDRRRGVRAAIMRSVWPLALWIGMFAILRFDPHPVLTWWFD
jgi:hypothetical protein